MRKGQSLVEYAVLLGIVITGLLIMQFYIKRAYQGRIKQEADDVGQQYSPGHTTALTETQVNSTTTSYTGGSYGAQEIPYGMTVTVTNSQNTMTKREGVDSLAQEGS